MWKLPHPASFAKTYYLLSLLNFLPAAKVMPPLINISANQRNGLVASPVLGDSGAGADSGCGSGCGTGSG